jgi:hypothetical protein
MRDVLRERTLTVGIRTDIAPFDECPFPTCSEPNEGQNQGEAGVESHADDYTERSTHDKTYQAVQPDMHFHARRTGCPVLTIPHFVSG